jgi:hypothetical protein
MTMIQWDAHAELHLSGDRENCEECQINARHAERWAAGGDSRVIAEQHRQDWIEWTDKRRPEGTGPLHDKEAKIKAFIVAHHREEPHAGVSPIRCAPA